MTLTIQLSPDAEQLLREKAEREGAPAETLAAAALTQWLEWETQDAAEASAGIQRGLDDFAAGRSRPFEAFAEAQRRKYSLSGQG